MKHKISKLAGLLFLPLMVTACHKGLKDVEFNRQFDWGEVRFNIESPASQISAKMLRIFRGGKPVLALNIKMSSGSECHQFYQELDSDSPRFQDRYGVSWTIAKPSGEGRPCVDKPGGARISESEFKKILLGTQSQLRAYGDSILSENELAIVPELHPAANIGTRSLMITVQETFMSPEYPVVGIIDLEIQKINALAIKTEWVEDERSEEFPEQVGSVVRVRTAQVDAKDAAYLSQHCRLEFSYVRPTQERKDVNEVELLKETVRNLNIPTKACP